MSITKSSFWKWLPGMKLADMDKTYRLTFILDNLNDADDDFDDEYPPCREVMHGAGVCGTAIGPGWGWPSVDSGWEPDLEDEATQGAIIFRLLEPLGILIVPQSDSMWKFLVGLDYHRANDNIIARMDSLCSESEVPVTARLYRTKVNAIKSVFAALDSEADG